MEELEDILDAQYKSLSKLSKLVEYRVNYINELPPADIDSGELIDLTTALEKLMRMQSDILDAWYEVEKPKSQVTKSIKKHKPSKPCVKPNIDPSVMIPDGAPGYLEPILKYSMRYGWVTARKVKQSVRAYSGNSTSEIRGFFLAAMNAGVGITRGEGERLQYNALG